jgi:serpin B
MAAIRRRSSWVLAGLVGVGTIVAGCGDDPDGDSGDIGDVDVGVLMADVERSAPDDAAASEAGSSVAALGADLYAEVASEPGNLAISPYSVAAALSMTRAGAAGETASEMDAVLHATAIDDLPVAFGSLDGVLATRSGEYPSPEPEGDPLVLELSFGNALWPQAGFPFEDDFLAVLAEHFGAGVNLVDYVADAEGARRQINDWVAEQTAERIPDLLAPGVVGAMTRLVLTNAVYLNAPWERPFEEAATSEQEFTLLDGTTVTVPMMGMQEEVAYATGDGWQAVGLPYAGGDLSMVVLVPDAGSFVEVEATVDPSLISEVAAGSSMRTVRLGLPRWEYRTQLGLNDALRSLGMEQAFDDRADFSAMSPEPLFVSEVVHEVFVSVDEEGTEAAAATAVVMAETSMPIDVVDLVVDRPFLYWIVDEPTGAVLFLGRVVDPTSG